MNKRVLVTGATGYLARPAISALRERGFEVHGVARHLAGGAIAGIDVDVWHRADLLDADAARALVEAVDPSHMLHLAWCTEHGRFWDDPANDAWLDATLRLAVAFRHSGGERFVTSGSCTQYDWSDDALSPDGIAREYTTPRHPATRYGKAKETTTGLLEMYGERNGMSVATGLVFFPYGPHEKPERLVPSLTRALLRGDLAATTAGTQVRDFLHVRDCGYALAALLESEVIGPVNIGSGTGASVREIAGVLARILGREDLLRIGTLEMRAGEATRLIADVTRLRAEVRFEPRFDLEAGLHDAVEWWTERQRTRRR